MTGNLFVLLVFWAGVFGVLTLAVWVADGFHKIASSRALAPHANPPGRSTVSPLPRGCPARGSSGVPDNESFRGDDSAPVHRFADDPFFYENPDPDSEIEFLWEASCAHPDCRARIWNLPSRESCEDWMQRHQEIERDLETWAAGRVFDWQAEA